ncbi:hydrophobin-251 [Armillaria fumosa]|nr:hydrophobin-251 [Armillaria fumosa]
MFARISAFTLLALPLLVTATDVLPHGGGDGSACSATGTVQCCESTKSVSLGPIQTLLGLLGVVISDLTADVSMTCSPITVLSVGRTECNNQVICCDNNSFNGLVALGCMPINISL